MHNYHPNNDNIRPKEDRQTKVSKELTALLRHTDLPDMDSCGAVPLSSLSRAAFHTNPSPQEIIDIKRKDTKGRYQIIQEEGDGDDGLGREGKERDDADATSPPPSPSSSLKLRAVNGHSIPLINPLLRPVVDASEFSIAIHATSEDNWHSIQESKELKPGNRCHVHFATEPQHMRKDEWASVLLKLDLKGAMGSGITFCKADNGVLLCERFVPVRFLKRVEREELTEEWQR